jgi:integrase
MSMKLKDRKFNFTKRIIDSLPNAKNRDYYHDTKEKNLILQITSKGSKAFYFYKKFEGKPLRIKLGDYPALSIERARTKAMEYKVKIANDVNPARENKRLNQMMTFEELFDDYIENYAKNHKKSWEKDIPKKNLYLKPILNKKISRIDIDDIRNLHNQISSNGVDKGEKKKIYIANRVLQLTKAIFNYAINSGIDINNPCKKVKLFTEKSRDRYLLKDEMGRFFRALDEEANETIKDYVYISLFTGARKSNVLSMRWQDINFDAEQWKIQETKNGDSLTIPLHNEVIDILEARLKKNKGNSQYVFPSDSSKGHLIDPKRAWKRILQKANIQDFRIHDLRRTFGSYQAMLGASGFIIGKSLGHKSQKATAVYSRLDIDPVKQSQNLAIKEMMRCKDGN